MSTWSDFFNGEHAIYVNDRHRALHDRRVAQDVAALIRQLRHSPDAKVLDYGCGEATQARLVAAECGTLLLSDAAPALRGRLVDRYGGDPRIRVLAPEEVRGLPDASLDIVVVNSLLQYLTQNEFLALADIAFGKLQPGGRLVLGDVIPPDLGPVADAAALLRLSWTGGFVLAALTGLARIALSDYRRLRQELGLTRYDEEEMVILLRAAGFEARRHRPNIGHNQRRMTFLARKPS